MRLVSWLGFVALAAGLAQAQCPPSCVGGGGPGATDCFVAYANAPGTAITCTEGDASCDVDGLLDGVCTFGLAACTNVAVGACSATPLDSPVTAVAKGSGGSEFVSALGQLSTTATGCTSSGLVKLPIELSATKLKPAKLTLRVTAVAGGKKDKDKLKLVCNPGRPTLATNVQPIFTAACTNAGCHAGEFPERNLSLENGDSAAGLAQKALASPKTARVKPGSLKKSYLARTLLGVNAVQMPEGCPDDPTKDVCLTPAEIYTILAWIQAGALP